MNQILCRSAAVALVCSGLQACGSSENDGAATGAGPANAQAETPCSTAPAGTTATTTNLMRVPEQHRPEESTCSGTMGPCPTSPGKTFDCSTCVLTASGATCPIVESDAGYAIQGACLTDGDCDLIDPGGVCSCEGMTESQTGYSRNTCVFGNCRVDADCGTGGYCSPSRGTACAFRGVEGYHCHTSNDRCFDDSDCVAAGCSSSWCIYQPDLGYWACSFLACSG